MAYGLYLHIPFCRHRCAYCDFNTYAGLEDLIPAYTRALGAEIRGVGAQARQGDKPAQVSTVFFGGGTPSLLPPTTVGALLDHVRASFQLAEAAEITLEANPGTVQADQFEALRRAGVNRLSFGMQSSHPDELRLLERQHGMAEVSQAVRWAREAGFGQVNLDLIYGLPNQPIAAWQSSLRAALDLEPDHVSLYALSLEFGTPMRKWVETGTLPEPDPDLAADMYEWASETLSGGGFLQYELSNWARSAPEGGPLACQHNLHVWRHGEYFGLGAGAHGFANGWRVSDVRSPRAYIQRLDGAAWDGRLPFSPATEWAEKQDAARLKSDRMILGLRLTSEGVSEAGYAQSFGAAVDTDFGGAIDRLSEDGLLTRSAGRICLTPRGRLLGNRVFEALLSPQSDLAPS